jgi:hypothetical protein
MHLDCFGQSRPQLVDLLRMACSAQYCDVEYQFVRRRMKCREFCNVYEQVRHTISIKRKYDEYKLTRRTMETKKRTTLKKIEKKLKKCYFQNESCVVCLESHEYGYMGNNPSCKQQHNNIPSVCKSCIILMVVSKKDSHVECSRCAPKCTMFK